MKKVTLFILLVSLLLPISLSAQSVKSGGQKVKIAISGAEPTYFTTLASENSGAPTNLVVSNIEPYAAQVSWEGTNNGYNLRYREIDLTGMAMVTLKVDNIWPDGSGYQMLLDADATAYGTIIPEEGGLTSSGDADASVYDEFDYKIPTNADGALNTANMVSNNSVTIYIPAGTYDWCITNPTPEDRVWIAGLNGNVGGRQDDYVFEEGRIYEFHVYLAGVSDKVDVTITDCVGSGDPSATAWTYANNVTTPYNLTGLSPKSLYEVQVQGDSGEETEWISTYFVTLTACPVPYDVVVEPEVTTANVTWIGFSDKYNLHYRTVSSIFEENWDGEIGSWTNSSLTDKSGIENENNGIDGSACFCFYYNLNPPQYLFSPELSGVNVDMVLEFQYRAKDGNYPESFQVGYSSTNTDIDSFTFGEEITTEGQDWHLFSEVIPAGTKYFCVKYNSYDKYKLLLDDFVVKNSKWTTIEDIEDTKYEITDLEPNTKYDVEVQGLCDENATAWSERGTFTTLPALELVNDDNSEDDKNSKKLNEAVGLSVNVQLKDRTFFKDGNWNTLCLPFSVSEEEIAKSPLAGAIIKQFYDGDVTGTHVDIVFKNATGIEAGEYYLFKWEDVGEDIANPVFKNVEIENAEPYHSVSKDNGHFTVFGNYDSFAIDPSVDGCLTYYLTSNGELKYSDRYRVLKTFRIFFRFAADNDSAGALEFNLDFGEGNIQTGIVELDGKGRDNRTPEDYYNLHGVKYNGKPVQKGVYVNNGQKVVIK